MKEGDGKLKLHDRLEEVTRERIKTGQEIRQLMEESPPRENKEALLAELEAKLALLNDEYKKLKRQ